MEFDLIFFDILMKIVCRIRVFCNPISKKLVFVPSFHWLGRFIVRLKMSYAVRMLNHITRMKVFERKIYTHE